MNDILTPEEAELLHLALSIGDSGEACDILTSPIERAAADPAHPCKNKIRPPFLAYFYENGGDKADRALRRTPAAQFSKACAEILATLYPLSYIGFLGIGDTIFMSRQADFLSKALASAMDRLSNPLGKQQNLPSATARHAKRTAMLAADETDNQTKAPEAINCRFVKLAIGWARLFKVQNSISQFAYVNETSAARAIQELAAKGFDSKALNSIAFANVAPGLMGLTEAVVGKLLGRLDLPLGNEPLPDPLGPPSIPQTGWPKLDRGSGAAAFTALATTVIEGPDGQLYSQERPLTTIVLSAQNTSLTRAIESAGLPLDLAKQTIVGHEIGHCLWWTSRFDKWISESLAESAKTIPGDKIELIKSSTQELFSDMIGILAVPLADEPRAAQALGSARSALAGPNDFDEGSTAEYQANEADRQSICAWLCECPRPIRPADLKKLAFDCLHSSFSNVMGLRAASPAPAAP